MTWKDNSVWSKAPILSWIQHVECLFPPVSNKTLEIFGRFSRSPIPFSHIHIIVLGEQPGVPSSSEASPHPPWEGSLHQLSSPHSQESLDISSQSSSGSAALKKKTTLFFSRISQIVSHERCKHLQNPFNKTNRNRFQRWQKQLQKIWEIMGNPQSTFAPPAFAASSQLSRFSKAFTALKRVLVPAWVGGCLSDEANSCNHTLPWRLTWTIIDGGLVGRSLGPFLSWVMAVASRLPAVKASRVWNGKAWNMMMYIDLPEVQISDNADG